MAERNGLGIVPTNFILPEGLVGYSTDPEAQVYGLNLEKAKQLLTKAGYDFKKELNIYALPGYGNKGVETFVNNLVSIGVNAKLVLKPGAEYPIFLPDKPFGIAFMAGANELFDGVTIEIWFGTGQFGNFYNYSNPALDKLLLKAKSSLDDTVRADLYNQAVKMVRKDAVFIPMFWETALEASRSDVKGYRPQAHNGRAIFYELSY